MDYHGGNCATCLSLCATTEFSDAPAHCGPCPRQPTTSLGSLFLVSCLQSRSWLGAMALQFLPNLLSFFSMYVAAPFLLFRLARFEGHLTTTGRQSANFVKLLVFFLVNLFLFKASAGDGVAVMAQSMSNRHNTCLIHAPDLASIEQRQCLV